MKLPGWQRWQTWRTTGVAMWLVISSSAIAPASDLESVGGESRAGAAVVNPFAQGRFDQGASPTLEPEAVEPEPIYSETIESPPSCHWPAAEEATITPMDESPSEPWAPPAELSQPPSEPWEPPVATPADSTTAPIPSEPESEMLEDLEAVWSEGFETAPAAAPESSENSGASNVTPFAPTTAELSRQLLPTVRKAYGLAQHGAVYAAQTEFIQVLRRIAEAKDAAEGVDTHSRALAAGLRALDEADDFAPHGAQLEADMNVAVMVSSHRTPVLLDAGPTTRPAEAIALYHQFARQQLAQAVAGEQAGSMALYGLGKVQNRLAYEADGELRHERKALTMFLAALDAGPGNHLAANEIGVLLSRGGQPAEAAAHFCRAIDLAPTSTSYHNLAVVERKMGYHEQAAANEQYAWQLAERDRFAGATSRAKGVQWVAPQELSRIAQPLPIEANQNRVTSTPQRLPQPPAVGPMQTVAKWPQKLVPGIFRR
ncbi:MAG: hypothetical protein WD971_03810 [Pirellulales bacterium]